MRSEHIADWKEMLPGLCRCVTVWLLWLLPAMAQMRPAQVVILIGPPGSGKSVQAKLLSRQYNIPAISMASLLLEEFGTESAIAKALAAPLASGEAMGDDAANRLMKARLLQEDAGRGFILDGYPSTESQAQTLDAFLKAQNFPSPAVVILSANDDVLRGRLKKRKRADDAATNVERRLRDYSEVGTFTEKWYGSDRVVRVDANGDIQNVARSITAGISNLRAAKGLTVRPPGSGELKKRDAAPPEP